MPGEPPPASPGPSGRLDGLTLLVTRPAAQADSLCHAIEALGGRAMRFPVIEIAPPRNPVEVHESIERFHTFDVALFISVNAAEQWLEQAPPATTPRNRPRMFAVGAATATVLERAGLGAVVRPQDGADSEALLRLPELGSEWVAGRSVLIVRGEGGRDVLARTLTARGARVEHLEVYRRVRPNSDPTQVLSLVRKGEIHCVVVTSGEGLHNLFAMLGQRGDPWLKTVPLIVPSPRIAALGTELGTSRPPVVAAGASDDALVEAILRWTQAQGWGRPGDLC